MAIQQDIVGRVALNRNAAGYVRVSTKEQSEATQVQQLVAQGVPREQIFVDAATSGTTNAADRPGFRALCAYISAPEHAISTLYVFEISRIGRSFIDTLNEVRRLEKGYGVMVWSLSQKEEWTRQTEPSVRNLMLAIFSWVAEREHENLRERTKAGVARARGEGKHVGRPFREINWRKVEELRAKGLSYSSISRVMDIPYSTLVKAKGRRRAERNTEDR